MRPGVVVLVGLPGAGKTTLARGLQARLTDLRVLDKDRVRDSLFAPCDYSAAERDVSFAAMLDAARYHLGRGRVVVFDGLTFARRAQVRAAESVAAESGGFAAVVVCDVPVDVAVERCEAEAGLHSAANRDADLVRRVASEMEEPAGAYLTLSMTEPPERLVEMALAYVEDTASDDTGD